MTVNNDTFGLERIFDRVTTPIEEFIHDQTAGGLVLMACAVLALVLANSPWAESYAHILHTPITLSIGAWSLSHSLHHWINDGLMTLFFFVVGLEIKREFLVGELADRRRAALPIAAAIGGMVVPAGIYALINAGGPGIAGWGVPMATDIAFAVGVLVLLGPRIPRPLLTMLLALAIVDDLGGVLVIALFYTHDLNLTALAWVGILFAALMILNRGGVRRPWVYFVFGTMMWLAMLASGVHATLAGILTAWTIPARPKYEPRQFIEKVDELLDRMKTGCSNQTSLLANQQQYALVQALENGVHHVEAPLQRLEHTLHLPVAFLIVPIFALANAGVPIEAASLGQLLHDPIALGIVLGLVLGKFLGITGAVWLAVRLGFGQLSAGVSFAQVMGVALIAGIGFTMSIFIAELAFAGDAARLVVAKTGILAASLIAGISGFLWLRLVSRPA
ncbi:MAG: Na+/H+ antiporter NhaA [Chromatiales bacterium]|nr:Na+/H+ antiporter NhaA [Chromatiales bacterium]